MTPPPPFGHLALTAEIFLGSGLPFEVVVHPFDAPRAYRHLPLAHERFASPRSKVRIRLDASTPRGLVWFVDAVGSSPYDAKTGELLG